MIIIQVTVLAFLFSLIQSNKIVTRNTYTKYITFTLLFVIPFAQLQTLNIRNLNSEPLLMLKKKDCRIQKSFIKIVHPINLTTIESEVIRMIKLVSQLDQSLQISHLATQKSRMLINNLRQLKPIHPKRSRRWDTLGKAWKWLAGSPDADDLRIINSTTNQLITQNNKQVIINNMISNRIERMTNAINELINKHNIENKILLKEYDALTLLLYIDNMNHVIEEIQDTIIRTKISLPNNKLLTLKEITLIESLLVEQRIPIQFPEEALEYATPKVAARDDLLLYILQIPKLYNQNAEMIELIPLINNNTIIPNVPRYVVKMGNTWFSTKHPDEPIQKEEELDIINDSCIHAILKGTVSHCTVFKTDDHTVKKISSNKILISNSKQSQIGTNCGPHNRTLIGNYLITFNNCTVVIDNQQYPPEEVIDNVYDFQGTFSNLFITWNVKDHYNISTLNNFTTLNRRHLEFMNLQQNQHKFWILSLVGGLSMTTITIIAMLFYVCLRRRKLIIKIKHPRRNNQKAEDDLPLPPGGVTVGIPLTHASTHSADPVPNV